jgi:hypothetical protein
MEQITVFKVGSFVEFFDGTIGQITAVQISTSTVYQVSYWTASVRHEEWFREFELQPQSPERQTIGFK